MFSDWAGLQNFQYLFQSSDAWQITRNTVCYNLAFIVLNAVLGITVAIFLNEVRGKLATRFYQSIMLVPFLISWVVVSYLAYAFLATDTGFINNSILEPLGLQPISWYTEAKYWPAILIFVQVWKSIGFQCVIYYSSLISISTDYVYARSDNAPVVVELQVDQDAIYYSLPIVNRVAFVFSFACLLLASR